MIKVRQPALYDRCNGYSPLFRRLCVPTLEKLIHRLDEEFDPLIEIRPGEGMLFMQMQVG